MNNQVVRLISILLCPIALWLAIVCIQEETKHEDLQFRYHAKPVASPADQRQQAIAIKPPLSPSVITRYIKHKPKPLPRLETLFYDFNTTFLATGGPQNSEQISFINKTEHEQESLRLSNIAGELDSLVKEDGEKLFAFNMLASNRIGLFRRLPDTRPPKCQKVEEQHVSSELLLSHKVSIVICYYNEAPSALLRTVYSILERSRSQLIEEIIIIDDYSDFDYDIEHIRPFLTSKLVRLVRTEKREGLIRARQFGAGLARGDILIFLDSHVEANVGWLEPLVETIQTNESTIACPMIDLINAETMIYSASPMVRGGLTWSLHFRWDSVPSENLKSSEDFAKPIETPTMAGGLYAISRQYFYHLGGYDPGMNLWGGENIELSLRTWMCGGRIVILPCSRLGHIFRKRRPYGPDAGQPDSLLYNSHRLARVWLDDYISKFYGHQPDAASLNSGDVSGRIELKHRLNCNTFDWYIDNVYPKLRSELTTTISESEKNLPVKASSLFSVKSRPHLTT